MTENLLTSEADHEQTQTHATSRGASLNAPCTLTMVSDLIKDATFSSADNGQAYYKVRVEAGKFESDRAETRYEVLESSSQKVIGTFTKPIVHGTEMVTVGDQSPVKRKQWLSSSPLGMMFSRNVLGKFEYDGQTFKWIKAGPLTKGDKRPILELHSKSSNMPIARFTPTHLDGPSAPQAEMKLIDAILEIHSSTAISIEMIVFSFVLVEKLRRDSSGELGPWQPAGGRSNPLGWGYTTIGGAR